MLNVKAHSGPNSAIKGFLYAAFLVAGASCGTNSTAPLTTSKNGSAQASLSSWTTPANASGAYVMWSDGPASEIRSPPLSLMRNTPSPQGEDFEGPLNPPIDKGVVRSANRRAVFRDPLARVGAPPYAMPSIQLNFLGLGFSYPGFVISGTPADTNGDVSPDHYIQIVNTMFAIFRKDGTQLQAPRNVNSVFQGFSGGDGKCRDTNNGDPLVKYDWNANRWMISQFAFTSAGTGSQWQCVAISASSDPTGSWNRYAFGPMRLPDGTDLLPDYGKIGVWPDGYYMTANMFAGASLRFSGGRLIVFERPAMLAGTPARMVYFQQTNGYGGALPGDQDGKYPPPQGTPGLFVSDDNTPPGPQGHGDELQYWKLHVDWQNPQNSTVTNNPGGCPTQFLPGPCPIELPVPAFKLPCDDFNADPQGNCVPQFGSTQPLATLGDRLMYRLAYRRFPGDHESLLVQRSVDTGTNDPTGIRWYELRAPAGSTFKDADVPIIFQQGTHAPNDGMYRWMGSMAMDHVGNISLGFSTANSSTRNAMWIAGRLVTDPPGQLAQAEELVQQGLGSTQPPAGPGARWGDYSNMAVDPSDDCTMWYTTMVNDFNQNFRWDSHVANFKFDNCQANEETYQFTLPDSVTVNEPVSISISELHFDGTLNTDYNGTADLTSNDPNIQLPATATFVNGVSSVQATYLSSGMRSVYANDHASPVIFGLGNTIVNGGPPARYNVGAALPPTVKSGTSLNAQLLAVDQYGNLSSNYNGTVEVVCSDPDATCPSTATFVNGILNLNGLVLISTGTRTVTVTDPAQPTLTTTFSVLVGPEKFIFASVPATPQAGQPWTFNLSAVDHLGRPAIGFSGPNTRTRITVAGDPAATLPTPFELTDGQASNIPVTLTIAGIRVLTATLVLDASTTNTSTQSTCPDHTPPNCNPNVLPGAHTTYTLRRSSNPFPASSENGAVINNVTVFAKDAYTNTVTTYQGTVHFSSNDPAAELPADINLVNGSRSGLSITFHRDGARTVTITDTVNPSLTGTLPTYVYANQFVFDNTMVPACAASAIGVHAAFADGTVDTSYTGVTADVKIGSASPVRVTFTNGQATTGPVTSLSPVNVDVKDTVVPTLLHNSAEITATRGTSPTTYNITGLVSTIVAGTVAHMHAQAADCIGAFTAYNGAVHVSSNDAQAVLPGDSHATSGDVAFDVRLRAVGAAQTVTVTDTVSSSITATVHTSVTAAAKPTVSVSEPADAATVKGTITISDSVTVAPTANLVRNEILVDGTVVATNASLTQSTSYNTAPLTDGTHTFSARATDDLGGVTQNDVSAKVSNNALTTSNASSSGCSSTNSSGLGTTLPALLGIVALAGLARRRRRSPQV